MDVERLAWLTPPGQNGAVRRKFGRDSHASHVEICRNRLCSVVLRLVETFGACCVGPVGNPSMRSEFTVMTLRRFEQLLSVISDSVLEDDFHVLDV